MTFHDTVHEVSDITVDLSVVLVADGDGEGLLELVDRYRRVLDARGQSYELLFLYDDATEGMRRVVDELAGRTPPVTAIALHPWISEDDAVTSGIRRAAGEMILTLPSWPEIDTAAIGELIDAVGEVDMATGRRTGQRQSAAQRPRIALAHSLLRLLFQQRFEDIFCRTRAGSRQVFRKVADLGVRQHFLPLVAVSEGYRVREVPVPPAEDAIVPALHRLKPLSHVSALVDMLSLYVGLKFLKRPLRFFGAIGVPLMLLGAVITAYLAISRLVFGTPLADRPALVFSVMMLVLGIQIVALGLIGEIIIFASSRRMRSYEIEKILRGRPSE